MGSGEVRPIHPPKDEGEVAWFAAHAVSDDLTLERIQSAHSKIPWLSRMEGEYGQVGGDGCYICWLIQALNTERGNSR